MLFNFKTNKDAVEEFARIDHKYGVELLERTMRNSDFKEGRLKLARELERDDDMGIDLDAEALIFQCKGLSAKVNDATRLASEVASGVSPGDGDPSADEAWTLHSRPAAVNKLWLDFKGGDVTGTAWNTKNPVITIPPYDKDNNPASFSTAELNDIIAIWRGVSEDYAPFDVDVTTVSQAGTDPSSYIKVMIGGDGAWYGSAGGVAYLGVFGRTDTYYQPAFVFPKMLGPDYAKYVWEAVSHEAGHNLGLSHDGTRRTAYWQGNSANYAAIMGVGYYKQLTVWDKGEYAGANNKQDDVAIIASYLGYIADENSSDRSHATPLTVTTDGATVTGTATGVVARQGVADFFSFTTGAGTVHVSLKTVAAWLTGAWDRSNLDAKVQVYNSAGALVAVFNPAGIENINGLGLFDHTVNVPAGTYYLAVSGTGAGTVGTDTGYGDHGSRGQFALFVTLPDPAANPPSTSPGSSPSNPPTPDLQQQCHAQHLDVAIQGHTLAQLVSQ